MHLRQPQPHLPSLYLLRLLMDRLSALRRWLRKLLIEVQNDPVSKNFVVLQNMIGQRTSLLPPRQQQHRLAQCQPDRARRLPADGQVGLRGAGCRCKAPVRAGHPPGADACLQWHRQRAAADGALFAVALTLPELQEKDPAGHFRNALADHCELVLHLPCWVGPKDESVYVYVEQKP